MKALIKRFVFDIIDMEDDYIVYHGVAIDEEDVKKLIEENGLNLPEDYSIEFGREAKNEIGVALQKSYINEVSHYIP